MVLGIVSTLMTNPCFSVFKSLVKLSVDRLSVTMVT